jgi:hypothetical protein
VSQDQENPGAPKGERVRPRGRENPRGVLHPDHRGYKPSTGGAITTVDDEFPSFLHAAYGAAVAKQKSAVEEWPSGRTSVATGALGTFRRL